MDTRVFHDLGAGGREFESRHSDTTKSPLRSDDLRGFSLFQPGFCSFFIYKQYLDTEISFL